MRNLLLAIFVFCNVSVFSQIDSNEKIEIEYVTINSTSPNVTISWKPYSDPSQIDGYIICQFAKTPGLGLDYKEFVGKGETQWSFLFDDVNQYPVQFAVIAYKITLGIDTNRTIYTLHRPSYLSLQFDSCSSAINLNWTKYLGWGNEVSAYRIFDKGSGQMIASVPATDSTFAIPNVKGNNWYRYYVEAVHKNGTYTSNSNVDSIYTKSSVSPDFIIVHDVNVVQNASAEITFDIDPNSELHHFRLFRSGKTSGDFQFVKEYFNYTSNTLIATDESLSDSTLYYKLQVIDNCDRPRKESNLATVIMPRYILTGQQITLNWDAYQKWIYGIREYKIFRSIGNNVASAISTTSSTLFTDDLGGLTGQQLSGNICYYIETVLNPDVVGADSYKAISRTVCVDVASQIFIPQAFTPNFDGQNDEYKPSFAFLPSDYTMIIFNRNGSKIFESKVITNGWNGLIKGVKAPEGAYIYFITFTTSSGNRIEKRGSLTVIYP